MGKVVNVAIYEENKVLGVEIGDDYNEDIIIEKLGDPNGKGMHQGIKYMNYFVDEYILIFYENYLEESFSAGIRPAKFFQSP